MARRRPRILGPVSILYALAFLWGAAGCETPPPIAAFQGTGADPAPAVPAVTRLAAGTRLRLRPLIAPAGVPTPIEQADVCDAALREALRQSPRFDFDGAESEPRDGVLELEVHYDDQAGRWTSTLVQADGTPLPLSHADGKSWDAIDRLALASRQALGEGDATARPIAQTYSRSPSCIEWTEAAAELSLGGRVLQAVERLRRARREDPGCTMTLAGLAAALLASGQADEAVRTARSALTLDARLAPTTSHRLARVLLLARSTAADGSAGADELLRLATVTIGERPADPEPRFSRALALNLLGRYAESGPVLDSLAERWPNHPGVGYHRTFAALATERYADALTAIESVRDRLPMHARVLPRALALYHNDRHDQLAAYLRELETRPVVRNTAQLHEVRRMQMAHAILRGDEDGAVRAALTDLEWVRRRSSRLDRYAVDVAEVGEVLVRLDRAGDLRAPLRAFEQLGEPPELFSNVLVYLGGLIEVAMRRERAVAAEAHLDKADHRLWSSALKAAAHRRRGELMDELKERVFGFTSSDAPLPRAALARALRAAGEDADAAEAVRQLRARLLAFRLHRLREHPLLSPGAALAFLISPVPSKR